MRGGGGGGGGGGVGGGGGGEAKGMSLSGRVERLRWIRIYKRVQKLHAHSHYNFQYT